MVTYSNKLQLIVSKWQMYPITNMEYLHTQPIANQALHTKEQRVPRQEFQQQVLYLLRQADCFLNQIVLA